MKNTHILGGAIALVLVVGLFIGFSGRTGQVQGVQTEGVVKIGAIMILSGEGAAWGEASRNGMALAIEDINKNGGIDGLMFEGLYEDDSADPKQAVSAFNKLVSADGVKYIIGPNWSNTGDAVKGLAPKEKVVMISPSLGVKEFNESSDYLFNTWQHDFILARKLAEHVYGKGHRHVALFGANDIWVMDQTKNFTERFEELGGTVEILSEPMPGTTDLRSEAAKVAANKKIDAVVMTTDGLELTIIGARALRDLGVKVPFFNITTDAKIIAECAAACEGMVFPTSLTPTNEFTAKYKAAFNREVEIGADSAYDAVMMIAEAIKETGSTDPEVVKEYIADIKEYNGMSGPLTSDGKRGFTKSYLLKVVRSGVAVNAEAAE